MFRMLARIGFVLLIFTDVAVAQKGSYLGHLTWPEAEQRLAEASLVIVPFAAGAKEHGPHLPMNADRAVLEYLVDAAVGELPVIAAPPVLYGWFPAFRAYPGTEVADPIVFQQTLYEIGLSLTKSGAKRIVFLNTGIRQATGLPISIAARELRSITGVPVLVVSWDDLETDEIAKIQEQKRGGHADEIETSIHLFLQPELVQMDKAPTDYGKQPIKDYPGYAPGRWTRDPADPNYNATGIYGDATLASADKGRRVLNIMRQEWLKALRGFAKTPTSQK